jgi:phenylalanyl-tRNA synthetase beta chain
MRLSRARRVIGADITLADCTEAFDRLGLAYTVQSAGAAGDRVLTVTPPARRFDLSIEEDLIEEVVRIWGYERLPQRPARMPATMSPVSQERRSLIALKRCWADRDWNEVVNYSFVSASIETMLQPDSRPIALRNPIAETMNVMRTQMWGGLIGNLRHNLNRKSPRVRLFEVGRVFHRDPAARAGELSVTGIIQPLRFAGLAWGPVHDEQWGERARPVDFFDVKADLQAIAGHDLSFEAGAHPALHPGQSALIRDRSGAQVGWLGSLHPRLLPELELSSAPIVFELDLAPMLAVSLPAYRELSRFPVVVRDLAFVVSQSVSAAELLHEIETVAADDSALAMLRNVKIFDEYRGKGLENKEKSLAFRFWLQDTQGTLSDAQADAAMKAVESRLAQSHQARLRSS